MNIIFVTFQLSVEISWAETLIHNMEAENKARTKNSQSLTSGWLSTVFCDCCTVLIP